MNVGEGQFEVVQLKTGARAIGTAATAR